MWSFFILVNKHFWKSITGPIFCFVLPSLLLFFVGLILGYTFIMPGGLAFPILTVGLVFMPQSIFEFKNSSLLKRVSLTDINFKKFFLILFVYNFFIIIFSVLIQFLLSFLIFFEFLNVPDPKSSFINSNGVTVDGMTYLEVIQAIDWPSFIYSLIVIISLTMIIGFSIASIAKSSLFIISIGIAMILITMFLAPTILPIQMIVNIELIKYIGYFWPLKYPMGTLIESFNGNIGDAESYNNFGFSTIWDIQKPYIIYNSFGIGKLPNESNIIKPYITYFQSFEKIINLVFPYILSVFFLSISFLKFSWETRSENKLNIRKIFNYKKNKQIYKNIYIRGNPKSKFILEANNITKEFKNKKNSLIANNEISIKFIKNKNTAIIGGNGAGKTTFIEMLLGITKPDSGYFKYNYEYQKKFNKALGVQFQSSSYPFGLKCNDIVTFFKDIYNLKISKEELDYLIDEFGVKKFYNKNASSLSGGQQQRLNLLLAILHKPKIIFLDELSNGLDINIRNKIKSFIKKYSKENNITLILISHDMNEVEYLCDRIIVLKEGKVVADQNKKEILEKYKNIENFATKYLEK